MTDTDRNPYHAAERIYSQLCCRDTHVRSQSRTVCRVHHHCRPLPIPSASRRPTMTSAVTGLYFLSTLVGYASCSQSTILPSDVAPNSFGTFNFDELKEIIYDIQILKVPIPEPVEGVGGTDDVRDVGGSTNVEDVEQTTMAPDGGGRETTREEKNERIDDVKTTHSEGQHLILSSKYGQKYLCTLPQEEGVDVGSDSSDLENETRPNSFNVSALLHPLTKQPCLTKNTGWWTYEYCHGDYIRQFHSEAAKTVKNVWIGYYQNETVWNHEEIRVAKERMESLQGKVSSFQIHHNVYYVNGTTCDLTGKPRRATAKIFCSLSGEEQLLSVVEKETCDYVLHIETPLLCRKRLFQHASLKKPHSLSCSPLLSQEEFQQYTEKQERLKLEKEQWMKKKQEELSSRMKAGKGIDSKPTRKQPWTISDLLDPDADLDEMTEQVKLNMGWSKSKSNSKLFDSGAEEQEIHSNEGEVEAAKDEELQKVADRFGRDVLEGLMKGLSSDMSRWVKEKDPSSRGAWERAIKKTQETVAKLAEMKDGEEKSREDEPSKLKHFKGDKLRASSEQSSHPEEHRTKDGDGFYAEANYQEQEKKSFHNAAADISKSVPSSEEEVRDTMRLKEQIKQLRDLNREALERRIAAEKVLGTEDDLTVEEEEEEEIEAGVRRDEGVDGGQKSSDRAAADISISVPSSEEEVRKTMLLKEKIKQLRDLNREALERRIAAEKELDTEDDLTVEEEEEEEMKGSKDDGGRDEGVGNLDEEQKSSDSAAADKEEEEGEGELDEESLTQLEEEIVEKLQKQLNDIGLGNNANIDVKFFTLPSNMLDEFLAGDEDEEDDTDDDDEEGSYDSSEEDGVQEELDARGNPKESTSQSQTSTASHHDKNLPAGSGVGQLGGQSRSKKEKTKKGKRNRSEVKVFHVKLDDLVKFSESDEEDGDDDSSNKGSKALVSSLLEQFLNPMSEERRKVEELESNYEQVWEETDRKEAEKRRLE